MSVSQTGDIIHLFDRWKAWQILEWKQRKEKERRLYRHFFLCDPLLQAPLPEGPFLRWVASCDAEYLLLEMGLISFVCTQV